MSRRRLEILERALIFLSKGEGLTERDRAVIRGALRWVHREMSKQRAA